MITGCPEEFKEYLTSRQFEVLTLIYMGYNRKEIGNMLMPPVCVQAVHQIIPRIRKRLRKVFGKEVKPTQYVKE